MKNTVAKNAAAETSRRNSVASGLLPRVPSLVNEVLNSHGQPLDPITTRDMSSRFGHDFSKVRVHADGRAAEAAEALDSHAFTFGADIVFGLGQYSPQTNAGRRLLAHELTHVVQQHNSADAASSEVQLNPSQHYEQEAHTVAETLSANGRGALAPRLSTAPLSVQRVAKWQYGTVSQELNLAERLATGHPHAGQTLFLLNGTPLTPGINTTTALNALIKPTFKSTPRADGKGMECTFDTLPTNEGTYDTKIIKEGRWQFQTTKNRLATLFPALKPCVKAGGGDAFLTIQDNPDVTSNSRAHEEQHAIDDKETFNSLVVPWDDKLTQAKAGNLTGNDPSDKDCQETLYASSSGSPTDLISDILKDINKRAATFHRSAAGRNVVLYDVQSDDDCNAVRAKAK